MVLMGTRYTVLLLKDVLFVLFVLSFNNNFSVMLGQSHHFLGFNQYFRELMWLAQGHNRVL